MNTNPEHFFLETLFAQLNSINIRYAVMRNYQTLPDSSGGSDLDLLIDPQDESVVRDIIFESIKHTKGTVIGCSSTFQFFKVFAFGCNHVAGDRWWGLRIDVNVGYTFKGITAIDLEHSFNLQTWHDGIKVLEPGFAAVLGVLKEVLNNGLMPERYRLDAVQAVQNDWERLSLALAPMGDKSLALFREMLLADNKKADVVKPSCALRRAFFIHAIRRSPIAFMRNRFLHEWAKIRSYIHPSGVIVAILGTDGVGKSTVINAIKPVLDDATHGALEIKHLRPSLLPPLARLKGKQAVQIGPVLDPHGSTPSGTLGSFFRLAYLTLDYVLGYWLLLRPKIAKSPTMILFDRYCYDIALDPHRFRLDINQTVIEWFIRWIPKPDIVLCLHADPSVILMRKQELTPAEVIRQVNALRELAQQEPRAILVSTEGTVEEVRDKTLDLLQTKLSNRFFKSRLGKQFMKIKPCCECCGGQSQIKVANKRNHDLYRCESCGLIFVWPQPSTDELQKVYDTSDGYYSASVDDLSITITQRADGLNRLLKAVGLENGRLLDVGCATGALIYHLKNMGWDVCGVEINPGAVAIARKHNLDVLLCRIQDNPYKKGTFDVIHMGDVIEYVDSPAQILDISHSLLKANGVLVLRTPNSDCSFAKLTLPLSKYLALSWPHSEAPYHLFDFSPNSLSQLLMRHGFQVFSIGYESTSSFAYIIGGMGYFDDLKRNIKKRRHSIFSFATIRHIPMLSILTIVFFPIFWLSKALDRLKHTGNVMNIVSRRSSHILNVSAAAQDDKGI